MNTIILTLKHGKMEINVEQTTQGWRRVARYHLNDWNKTLTHYSKYYKTANGATKDAQKYAEQQRPIG